MTDAISTRIDDMKVGEKPAPLVYQFQDDAGAPLNITGYTAKVNITERHGQVSVVAGNATVPTGTDGKVQYIWTGTEFPNAGHWIIEIWVGNGTNRFASINVLVDVHWPEGPAPSI